MSAVHNNGPYLRYFTVVQPLFRHDEQLNMPPKRSSSNVNSASFLDLKAELSKKEEDFKKAKGSSSTGRALPIVGGVRREEKVRIIAINRAID